MNVFGFEWMYVRIIFAKEWKTKNLSVHHKWWMTWKMNLWICKVTAYTHADTHTHFRTGCTILLWMLIVCHRHKHFVYIYMFIYCMSHKWLLRIWYGCYHNLHARAHTHRHTHIHATSTSSTKSSIILYYLVGPSTIRRCHPFWVIYIVIVSRFDLHLIKCIINNSIPNQSTPNTNPLWFILITKGLSSHSHFCSFCFLPLFLSISLFLYLFMCTYPSLSEILIIVQFD